MSCFARVKTETGLLWLGRGKLGPDSMASRYAYPSAAKIAIEHFNEKLTRQDLPPQEFEIAATKYGVPFAASDPFTLTAPEPTPEAPVEVFLVAQKDHVRIVKINGKFDVCILAERLSSAKEAYEFAQSIPALEQIEA